MLAFDLTGKVAIVTGGASGIGVEYCTTLASQGCSVAIFDVSAAAAEERAAQLAAETGRTVRAYDCNVADEADVRAAVSAVLRDFGHIDILVNNAGITRDKLMLSMKEADFDDVIDVNLKGVFNMMRHVYPIFAKQKSGKIVNISSVAGLMGNPGQTNYSAAKAGIIGMTKSAARELAGRGICCNAVAPGFIETDMTAKFVEDKSALDKIPLKRMGKAEEVANLVFFLASPMSDYITGEVIRCDGGMAM